MVRGGANVSYGRFGLMTDRRAADCRVHVAERSSPEAEQLVARRRAEIHVPSALREPELGHRSTILRKSGLLLSVHNGTRWTLKPAVFLASMSSTSRRF